MSGAGRPGRVRTNANASATVEVSGPVFLKSHSSRYLGCSASASEPPPGRSQIPTQVRVVLEVLADARAGRRATRHADLAQVVGRADAGEQQELRRAERAGREEMPRARAGDLRLAAVAVAHAGRAAALEVDAQHLGAA